MLERQDANLEFQEQDDLKETGRLEAFSDGVLAIAVTLLVLDIKVPHADTTDNLGEALLKQWPNYAAFATSFLFIAVMWINHHRVFKIIKYTDTVLLLLNSLLLMAISAVPFTTALLAEYFDKPGQFTAVLVFHGLYFLVAILFNLLWFYAASNERLFGKNHDRALRKSVSNSYRFGPLLYIFALALVFVNIPASLAVNVGLAIFFALPGPHAKDASPKLAD